MDVSKLYERAEEAIKRKNFDYAVDILAKQILPIYPNDVKARKLLRGTVIRKCDEKGYPSAMATKMKTAAARAKLGTFQMRKLWDRAIEECEKCLHFAPKDVNLLFTLAQCAREGGHNETAIATLENAIQIDGSHTKSLKLLGLLYREGEDLEKARSYYQRVVKIDSADHEAKKADKDLGALITQEKYRQAASSRDLVKSDRIAKESAKRDEILRTPEQVKAAIEEARKELERDPEDRKALRRIGELYFKLEEFDQAIEWLEKAFEKDPTSFDTKKLIGDVKIERLVIQARQLRQQVKADPGNEALKRKYMEARKVRIDFQVAEFESRVQEHPTDLDLRYHYGHALYQRGQYEDAIEQFQKSCKDPRFKLDSFNYMGQSFLRQEEPDMAIKQFERALQDVKGMGEKAKLLHYNLGCAYQALSEVKQAIGQFEQILEHDVKYKDIRNRIKELRTA